jgi:hypothetical protein
MSEPIERLNAGADLILGRLCTAPSGCVTCEIDTATAAVIRAEAKRLKRTDLMRAFGGAPLFKPQPEILALADLLLAGES